MDRFIVGLGEILWDRFPAGKRLGGAPANFAYHAGRFGHEALVVSAVGAGDAFTGAFIGSYLNGASIQEAHGTAVRVSAFVCTRKGAMPEIDKEMFHVAP